MAKKRPDLRNQRSQAGSDDGRDRFDTFAGPRLMALCLLALGTAAQAGDTPTNLALLAEPSTSFVSGHETLDSINDDVEPGGMNDHRHGCYGNWPKAGTQWVQYEWSQPVSTRKVDVYWWEDGAGVRLPTACRLLTWDGKSFVPVPDADGLGVAGGKWNTTTFAEVRTAKMRLEFDSRGNYSTGIIEWKVYDSGNSPRLPPRVTAGIERVVVLPAPTHLLGQVRGPSESVEWRKASGPGEVTFADPRAVETTAQFPEPGAYVLELSAANGGQRGTGTLNVRVEPPAPKKRLDPVPTLAYTVNSTFWGPRLKAQIVRWIPHCIDKLSDPALPEGRFQNIVEAANKNAGRPWKPHTGGPFGDAYTLNTVEAMCLALLVDPQGDAEVARSQAAIRAKLDEWLPVILAAQEPDGYFQTRFTLAPNTPRWSHPAEHEGYVAGYFMEAAVAHFRLTGGRDRRLYDAAKKLADCWDAHIGPPPKKPWCDGHQEVEQALVRLARLVNEVEGAGQGDRYVRLSRFLLDCRRNGGTYDQTHQPVTRQYEAVGHAVRAAYGYSAMADIAMETGDAGYHGAVQSIWNNLVHTKLYITGGLGSGESSEGFGANFSLPNTSFCESCAGCGGLFFQHKMNLAYHESRYADLMEDTLYNAVLGSVDLPGTRFTYTNPLDQSHPRYDWHGCPCCVGNIPRTLLMLPTWMYARDDAGVFVNLYIGSIVRVAPDLEIEQRTDYPWKGGVDLVVRPDKARTFSLRLRAPNRGVSALYRASPSADGIGPLAVNGKPVRAEIRNGYAVITRKWRRGDTVRFELPLKVQRVTADERVAANRGRVALRYGPLVYNIESVDQNIGGVLGSGAPLVAEWTPGLLDGVAVIRGRFADGSPLTAVPNYARNNRGGRSIVWIAAADDGPAPGADGGEPYAWPPYKPDLNYRFRTEYPDFKPPAKVLEDTAGVAGTVASGWWCFRYGSNKNDLVTETAWKPMLDRMNESFAYFRDVMGWPPDKRAREGYYSTIYLFGSGMSTDRARNTDTGGWMGNVRFRDQDWPMVLISYYPVYCFDPACNYPDRNYHTGGVVHEGVHAILADMPGCRQAGWFHEGGNNWLLSEAAANRTGDRSRMGWLSAGAMMAPFMPIECYSGWLQDGSFGGPSAEGVNRSKSGRPVSTWRNLLGGTQYGEAFAHFMGEIVSPGSVAWIWQNCTNRVLEGLAIAKGGLGDAQTRRLIQEFRGRQAMCDFGRWSSAYRKLLEDSWGAVIAPEGEHVWIRCEPWKATCYVATQPDGNGRSLKPETRTLPGWSGANQIPLKVAPKGMVSVDFKPIGANMSCQLVCRATDGSVVYSAPVAGGPCRLRLDKPAKGDVVVAVICNTDYVFRGEETRQAKYDYRLTPGDGVRGTADIRGKWWQ